MAEDASENPARMSHQYPQWSRWPDAFGRRPGAKTIAVAMVSVKGKYKRAWTGEGPDRLGTENELSSQECAANRDFTFSTSLSTGSRPFTID